VQELETSDLIELLRIKQQLFKHKEATSLTQNKIQWYTGKIAGLELAITLIRKHGGK